MDKSEAKQLLATLLASESAKPYSDLRELVVASHIEGLEVQGPSGVGYQIEVQYFWDDKPENTIRIMASIDNGRLLQFIAPLSQSELVERPNP